MEAREREREDRFEAQAEEMHETLWAGPIVPYVDDSPITLQPERIMRSNNTAPNDIDPETGCTTAEMKEQEVSWVLPIEISSQSQLSVNNSEGRVA